MWAPRWPLFFIAAALIWSWSLYLAGWFLTPKGHHYFWVTFDVSDYNAHLRWARLAWEGKKSFVNLFTTETHEPKTFNLHDWLVGKLARWFDISLHFSMRLVHTLGVIVFVLAAWWLAAPVLTELQQRTYLLMLCFLGGFVWLAMPEANTFIALATMSWFVWGKAMAALVMGSVLRLATKVTGHRSLKVALLGTIAGIVVGNIHPYALAPIGYGLVMWFVLLCSLSKRSKCGLWQAVKGALVALPAFAVAGWQAWAIISDPVYRAEFLLPLQTPPFWQFVLNYGVIFFLALLASFHALRQSRNSISHLLFITWLAGAFLAVYLTPTAQPRKLIEGVHLPMCILAAWAWHELVLPRTVVIRRHPTLVLLLIGAITPLTFWISQVRNFLLNDEIALHYGAVPFYLRSEHLRLIDWLAKNSAPDEAILCSYQLGNYIPVLTGRRVFIGHWGGTVKAREKLLIAREIWRGEIPIEDARELFRQHKLRYATATIYERHATKPRHSPRDCKNLPEKFGLDKYGKIVFRVGGEAVYQLEW